MKLHLAMDHRASFNTAVLKLNQCGVLRKVNTGKGPLIYGLLFPNYLATLLQQQQQQQ